MSDTNSSNHRDTELTITNFSEEQKKQLIIAEDYDKKYFPEFYSIQGPLTQKHLYLII